MRTDRKYNTHKIDSCYFLCRHSRSLTPPSGPLSLSLEAEDRLGVPSLGAGGQAEPDLARTEAAEGEGSDWASVASFPIHDEVNYSKQIQIMIHEA